MAPANYELPQKIVSLLTTIIGPLHEKVTNTHHYAVDAIIQQDKSVVGFLIRKRPIERKAGVSEENGLRFPVPIKPNLGGESTYIFTETFENCLDYIRQDDKQTT